MLDHIGISVSDFDRSVAFYKAALAPLSLSLIMSVTREETGAGAGAGFVADGKPFFWIGDFRSADGRASAFSALRAPKSRSSMPQPLHGGGRLWRAGLAAALPRELLWRLRSRPRRQQHRGGLSPAAIGARLAFSPASALLTAQASRGDLVVRLWGVLHVRLARNLVLARCRQDGRGDAQRLARPGGLPAAGVTVLRAFAVSRAFRPRRASGLALNPEAVAPPETLVIAVKPQTLDSAAPRLAAIAGAKTLVVSVSWEKPSPISRLACPRRRAFVRVDAEHPSLGRPRRRGGSGERGIHGDEKAWTERHYARSWDFRVGQRTNCSSTR